MIYICICKLFGSIEKAANRMALKNIKKEMGEQCVFSRVRTLNRILNSVYDEAFRPLGLKASQFNLLVVVGKEGPIRRVDIGKRLAIGPSTLTRNLNILQNSGWVEESPDGLDGRGPPLRLTAKGRRLVYLALPAWRRAQKESVELLGRKHVSFLLRIIDDVQGRASE